MGLNTMLARCTLVLSKASAKIQRLQVRLLAGETKDNIEMLEQYGFTSIPMAGASGLALFMGGDRSSGVVLAVGDKRYRLTDLNPGEVAIYNHEGAKVVIKEGRIVEVECDEYRVTTKRYLVQAEETISLKAGGLAIEAEQATSSAALEAPDMIIAGLSHKGHRHKEHDGPYVGGPEA